MQDSSVGRMHKCSLFCHRFESGSCATAKDFLEFLIVSIGISLKLWLPVILPGVFYHPKHKKLNKTIIFVSKIPSMARIFKYIERFYPAFLSVMTCCLLYKYQNNPVIQIIYAGIFNDSFLTAILTVASIVFGFLLTAITIIYQSDNPVITEIKRAGRFKELINFNKTAVKWTFFLVIATSVFLMTYENTNSIPYYQYFVGLWVYITVYTCLTSIRFLNIFYSIL